LACRGVRRILVCGVCARIPAHTVARVAEHALADAPWIVPHAAAVQFARAHADV
jgi:hypothetical protein